MKIIKPKIGGHSGCSFRELLDAWSDEKLIEIKNGPDKRSPSFKSDADSPEAKCWIEEQGNILLYDFPLLDRLKHGYKMCLFSNTYKEGENNKKWIFWPRYSKIYDKMKDSLRKSDKLYKCGFIGSPTNNKRNGIANYWSQICDVWHYNNNSIKHIDYLKICSNFRFGLCLPGVGPKCLRDIEYMGMGVIPIVVDLASMNLYHNKPEKNSHYLYVQNIEDFYEQISSLSSKDIKDMSESCIQWFEKNCSINGSFNTTMEIINE